MGALEIESFCKLEMGKWCMDGKSKTEPKAFSDSFYSPIISS